MEWIVPWMQEALVAVVAPDAQFNLAPGRRINVSWALHGMSWRHERSRPIVFQFDEDALDRLKGLSAPMRRQAGRRLRRLTCERLALGYEPDAISTSVFEVPVSTSDLELPLRG